MRSSNSDESGVDVGRREFLLGGGVLSALALAGTGVYMTSSDSKSSDEQTYLLQQGYLRYEVDPLSVGGTTVEEFYDYQDTSADPPANLIEDDDASRLFVYDGPVDASLVFLHGSPDVDHGGTARFAFSGLSRDQGEWAVRDDPRRVSDDFEPWDGGNQVVEWQWGKRTTDGGAFWGVLDRQDFTISVNPKIFSGVDSWRFLSGDPGDLDRYELVREKPAKIKPTRDRQVKQANVEIMPDSDPNEFDPYANEDLTVAVKPPPDGADDSEWIDPDDLDPGNYAVNFGSREYLAGQNAAQPQQYDRSGGTLFLVYKAKAAKFTLESAHGYLVGKAGEKTFFRGRDTVRPGGFDNVDSDPPQLVVSDIHADPGDGGLDEEYVAFENDGEEPLDIGGWTIRDDDGHAFAVPEGFTLDAGETIRLHTGAGDTTETALYWGRSSAVWNDAGDTIVVLDADATEVLTYTYPQE